jgi:hypothetical protein
MRNLLIALLLLIAAFNSAIAQPAKDGNSTGSATSGTTMTISATTTANPEIVLVGASVVATGATQPNLSIGGCGLSWSAFGTAQKYTPSSLGTGVAGWYATAASNLSACTITVTSDQTIKSAAGVFCSFSGINSGNAFDPGASPPANTLNETGSSVQAVATMSTSLAHSTLVTVVGQTASNLGGIGASTGDSLCASQTTNGALTFSNAWITYHAFTTTQTNYNLGILANTTWWAIFGAGLTADAPSGRSRIIQ